MTVQQAPGEKHKADDDRKIDKHQKQDGLSFPADLALPLPYSKPGQKPDPCKNQLCGKKRYFDHSTLLCKSRDMRASIIALVDRIPHPAEKENKDAGFSRHLRRSAVLDQIARLLSADKRRVLFVRAAPNGVHYSRSIAAKRRQYCKPNCRAICLGIISFSAEVYRFTASQILFSSPVSSCFVSYFLINRSSEDGSSTLTKRSAFM